MYETGVLAKLVWMDNESIIIDNNPLRVFIEYACEHVIMIMDDVQHKLVYPNG